MAEPSVSVVVPAFKQADFIEACLDSVAEQTYSGEVEVIVVDDASPDDVGERARAHRLRPKVIRQENTGVAGARNHGIREASGTYLAFLDADDRWHPDKLRRQVDALEALQRPGLCFTRYERVRTDGAPVPEPLHPAVDLDARARKLVYGNFIGNSTVLVHRDCLERVGGYPEDEVLKRGGQDYALWLRVASLFPIVYIPRVLTYYTVHAVNRVGTDPLKHLTGGLNALENFYHWAPERFAPMAGASYRSVVALRTARFMRDAVVRRRHYPKGLLRRAARELVR